MNWLERMIVAMKPAERKSLLVEITKKKSGYKTPLHDEYVKFLRKHINKS